MRNNVTMLRVFLIPPLLALTIIMAACSDDEDGGPIAQGSATPEASVAVQDQPDPVQAPAGTPSQPGDGVYEMVAENASFKGNDITLPRGQPSTIRVVNRDQLTHNLRIAGLDGAYDTEDDAVTEPLAIEPGGSGELSFAPAIPGQYTFRCDYHPGTMGGQITVE